MTTRETRGDGQVRTVCDRCSWRGPWRPAGSNVTDVCPYTNQFHTRYVPERAGRCPMCDAVICDCLRIPPDELRNRY